MCGGGLVGEGVRRVRVGTGHIRGCCGAGSRDGQAVGVNGETGGAASGAGPGRDLGGGQGSRKAGTGGGGGERDTRGERGGGAGSVAMRVGRDQPVA
eukprot:3194850-Heterocapsa_arctica.AAC.1